MLLHSLNVNVLTFYLSSSCQDEKPNNSYFIKTRLGFSFIIFNSPFLGCPTGFEPVPEDPQSSVLTAHTMGTVGSVGLEPTLPYGNSHLKAARLPVPPRTENILRRKDSNLQGHSPSRTTEGCFTICILRKSAKWDLNPYALNGLGILSPLRLPIPPLAVKTKKQLFRVAWDLKTVFYLLLSTVLPKLSF